MNHDGRGRGASALGRLKLMEDSVKNPELLEVHFTKIINIGDITDLLPDHKRTTDKSKYLCDHLNHKYLLSIDGWSSDSWRAPMILKSGSVPVIVKSSHTPLYFDAWVPWTHYVPVRADLSDLLENLMWLHNNDSKAKIIAENGKELFDALYTDQNMLEDAGSVFKRYAELMKYDLEPPSDDHWFATVEISAINDEL